MLIEWVCFSFQSSVQRNFVLQGMKRVGGGRLCAVSCVSLGLLIKWNISGYLFRARRSMCYVTCSLVVQMSLCCFLSTVHFLRLFFFSQIKWFLHKGAFFIIMYEQAVPKILQHVSVNNYRIPIYLGLKYNCWYCGNVWSFFR